MNDTQLQFVKNKKIRLVIWSLSVFLLVLFPLRHLYMGVDLCDSGYNYANFRYRSLEYMDSMWFFATWTANAAGSLLMRLPFGDTMLAMNIYTGLIVSITATVSYFFCVKKLQIPAGVAFVGELAALALCWAPSSVLYNYLTYLFLLLGTCSLYYGLVNGNSFWLAAAGIILGLNVGNRFSNLVHTGLILAVWAYGIWDKRKFTRILRDTGVCILGYMASLGIFLLGISLRYGLSNYAGSVIRLFGMTEKATAYAPNNMLLGLARALLDDESTYWTKRFLLLFGVLLAVCFPYRRLMGFLKKDDSQVFPEARFLTGIRQGICAAITAGFILWLIHGNFSYPDYASYKAILAPCVILFELIFVLAVCRILDRRSTKEERLLSLLLLLTVFLSSLGGNNAMYSSINNTFLVLPGFLWMCCRICRQWRELWSFPIKCVVFVALFFVLTSCVGFGSTFVYEEAAGGREMNRRITGVPVLKGMYTGAEKAESLEGLYSYLSSAQVLEKECILYGQIPGIAYYMGLTPAFNVWGDLVSYGTNVMEEDLSGVSGQIAQAGEAPLLILSRKYADYLLAGKGNSEGADIFFDGLGEQKLWLLKDFMDAHGYEITYYNEGFVVFETKAGNN